jgi:hypothetical protein
VPNLSDVFIADFSNEFEHRPRKHCVCVSVSPERYVVINTYHREMYDDFEISSADYGFLEFKNRFVSCVKLYGADSVKLINHVGNLYREDMIKVANKIQDSEVLDDLEKASVIPELKKWLLGIPST